MRQFFFSMFLAAWVLAACSKTSPSQPSSNLTADTSPTRTSQTPSRTHPPLKPTKPRQPATATASPSPTQSIPHDRPMIAYESSSPDKSLFLLDPDHGLSFAFDFPAGSIFATSFLESLSPDARYFVYYEGGTVDDYGSLNAKPPDFNMRILDLNTQDVIFSTPLLSPDFPKNLEPIVAMTEDEFWREEPDREVKLKEMNYTMQMTVLNYLRTVAWSPDGSVLAFASQNPGPSSDMYFFDPAKASARKMTSELGHVLEFTWAPDS